MTSYMLFQLRTFLIRNGLSTLFNRGSGAYTTYYSRQMTKWNISTGKKKQLTELLDKWAVHIQRKYGKARSQPLPDTYLSKAEPFLEEFAKLSPKNQALIGTAGSLVRAEDFMAILDEGMDEDEDLEMETKVPSGLNPGVKATKQDESLIVFFPGIPGYGKSALCKVILDSPGILGDDHPVHSLMGDFVKGQYWAKVDDACRRKPSSILLADKNAPNEEVWSQIEEMCGSVITYAVPVITDTEGLRPRDIRSVEPSLWLTNSMPALLVIEAALHSRIQRLEHRLMDLEPRVQALLEVLPNRLTTEVLEELRISKQALVELASRAGALKQMLLDILEDPDEIRRICIMGRNCTSKRGSHLIECSVPLEKQIAEEEEEEIEMLLENYLQSMRTTAIDASLGDSDGGRGVGLKKRCR